MIGFINTPNTLQELHQKNMNL